MNIRDLLKYVSVVSPEECEAVDFVVCGPESCFDDDVHTTCSHCGTPVVHRPHAPKSPPKICIECAIQQSKSEALPHV